MGRPSDSREVLIAEALGDFVKVLDRIDAVKPTLEKSCSELEFTADRLLGNIEPVSEAHRRVGARDPGPDAGAHHPSGPTLSPGIPAAEQIAAMQESARRIFKDEVGPPLERIAANCERRICGRSLRGRPG